MRQPIIKHTLDIFERLRESSPPLAPNNLIIGIDAAIADFKAREDAKLEELEDAMIFFGRRLWPYRRAFFDFIKHFEEKLGIVFLRSSLPERAKARVLEFEAQGGGFRDLLNNLPNKFFHDDDCEAIHKACFEIAKDIRRHAAQAAMCSEREMYERSVDKYMSDLRLISRNLAGLRGFAEKESFDRPDLANEILSYVRAVEYGLCALGPEVPYHAISSAEEYFLGRKASTLSIGL